MSRSVSCGVPLEATYGRFWALAGEDSDEISSVATGSPSPPSFYCRSVSEDECLLQPTEISGVLRREERRRRQREAACRLRLDSGLSSPPVLSKLFLQPCPPCAPSRRTRVTTPVMSPSTFLLDSFKAAEWVVVQRRKRKIAGWRRRRSAWPPERLIQRSATVFDRKTQIEGRMGLPILVQKLNETRYPQIAQGGRGLGFRKSFRPPAPVVQSLAAVGTLATAMASRGGGNPNRGRGPPGGGRGGGGWQGGYLGGRGSNFDEGGPSGTAGEGGDAGNRSDQQNNVFGDGVFRAGNDRPNYFRGGRRNFQGYNYRGGGRQNFQGSGGFNQRRFTGNNYSRYAATSSGLSEHQQKIVAEAAAALDGYQHH